MEFMDWQDHVGNWVQGEFGMFAGHSIERPKCCDAIQDPMTGAIAL